MIVADQKPLEEILIILQPYKKVLFLGCRAWQSAWPVGRRKSVCWLRAFA
jgi:hypothetical protein